MDQTITGSAGIASGETFGEGSRAHIIQTLIQGLAGIASEEAFARRSGVSIDPYTVPFGGLYLSY